jgi:hypothetical protein
MALSLDDILAPAAEPLPTRSFTFDALRGRPRFDTAPADKRNSNWLNYAVGTALAAKDDEPETESDEDYRTRCHAEVDAIADTLIVGWSVQDVPDGPHVPRPHLPAAYKEFFHKLIDLPQGLDMYSEFRKHVYQVNVDAEEKAIDPTVTAGNSSGG